MSDRTRYQMRSTKERLHSAARPSRSGGQALVEYVLILALVAIALIAVLAITGPAVGNVFSNAVYNLLGGTIVPRDTLPADDFWTQVAAVASFTPENPLLITNTPAPASSTPTTGPSPTATDITPSRTPSNTPTPGPSPTPPDQGFGYPFEDPASDPDWWQHDFTGLLSDWDAEFWDLSDTDGASWLPNMTTMSPGSGKWRTTYDTLDFTWPASPGGGVTQNFYARFTSTATLLNEEYILRLRKDDGMRVWIGGALIYDGWNWNIDQDNWVERVFTAAAGPNDVVVELFDNGWTARASVFITQDGMLLDEGDCNWALSSEAYFSAPTAWSDSPNDFYAPNSYCILRLRGTIDLTGAVEPKLQFYDRYAIGFGAYALVGVAVAGTNNWTDIAIHTNETNLGWTRQTFDLTNFGDPDGSGPATGQNFTNQVIELRFVLHNQTDITNDGWWIDDISVQELSERQYTVGFSDNMEGPLHWYAGGTWARTNEHVHSPGNAWSDSPGANYALGSNNILELDGVIVLDNDRLEGDPVVEPEMVFWHRYELGNNAAIYAEVSTDGRLTWTPLTGGPLASRTTNWAYTQVVIPLDAYVGQSIYFRFRLDARSGFEAADGWYIDDFSLRNRSNALLHLNWCDNAEAGGGSWLPMGNWAVVNGTDFNPDQDQSVTAHSGSRFFSDSPGANYSDNADSILQLVPRLDLKPASNPELSFWHQWDIAAGEVLHVEVSTNYGQSWTAIWTKNQGSRPPGYGNSAPSFGYDHVRSWNREVINLSPYNGQELMLRFRLDSRLNDAVDDGWWIDDICVQERDEPVYTLPFSEDFESGLGRWYAGGSWDVVDSDSWTGTYSVHDSPNGNYQHESNGILELRGAIDFTGAVKPTIYIWDRFELQDDDYALMEVSTSSNGGQTWTPWTVFYEKTGAAVTTSSWDRRQTGQLDMSAYIGRLVKIRFRLYAERGSDVADGWYIDDITVLDRNGNEPVFTLPFNETADILNDYWVFDETWARYETFRALGSGSALGPGAWTGQYYQDVNTNRAFDSGELRGTRMDPEIDFNWGSGGPGAEVGLDGVVNYFLVRWTRTINVFDLPTTYQIETRSDDGIRVFVDGVQVINAWADRGYNTNDPDTAAVTLDPGPHTIVVEYYERTSSARVRVDFGITTMVFTDSPNGDYVHNNDMSMTLEGIIDLRGSNYPALTFWHTRQLGAGDRAYIEISTDEGYTWTSLANRTGTSSLWTQERIDLRRYRNSRIKIRFRLDARSDTRVGDGWYIDDIQIAD